MGIVSTSRHLNFSSALLDFSSDIWDYVIVHELLHCPVPNHGKLWRSMMRAHLGHYEQREATLRSPEHQKPTPTQTQKHPTKWLRRPASDLQSIRSPIPLPTSRNTEFGIFNEPMLAFRLAIWQVTPASVPLGVSVDKRRHPAEQ